MCRSMPGGRLDISRGPQSFITTVVHFLMEQCGGGEPSGLPMLQGLTQTMDKAGKTYTHVLLVRPQSAPWESWRPKVKTHEPKGNRKRRTEKGDRNDRQKDAGAVVERGKDKDAAPAKDKDAASSTPAAAAAAASNAASSSSASASAAAAPSSEKGDAEGEDVLVLDGVAFPVVSGYAWVEWSVLQNESRKWMRDEPEEGQPPRILHPGLTYWFRFSAPEVWPMVSMAFEPCKFYALGSCHKEPCHYYHNPFLTDKDRAAAAAIKQDRAAPVCKFWTGDPASCKRGQGCKFSHATPSPSPQQQQQQQQ
jgi:hypothetical protein